MQSQAFGEVQERLRMTDGFDLFFRRWHAVGQVERSVIFLHGIEVHSGAFGFMGPELANDGSEVYGFDRRGFGKSNERDLPRGDTHGFDRHLLDLKEVVEFVHKNHPDKKLFIFGHSIGCAYALWYAANYPEQLEGLILAASPLKAGFKLPTSDTLKVAVAPRIGHHSMYDLIDEWPQAFRESEEYKLISQDELCTKEFGLGFLFNVQTKLANKMLQNASKIEKPVLLIHGDSDIVALPSGSNSIFAKLASKDKTLHTFAGADHWFYQSIIPTTSSKYSLDQKRTVSIVAKDWLKTH
ncbi:MAG: lysophospholipase [Chloroflexi bacterium]|nr:lysophospholipase [Chloroflexota bacterium]